MQIRNFYLICLLILSICSFHSCQEKKNKLYTENLKAVIAHNYQITNLSQLQRTSDSLQILYSNQVNEIEVIELVLTGKIVAQNFDNINPRSNQLLSNALNQVNGINNLPLKAWVNTNIGFYLYSFNNYEKALPYFLQSSRYLDELSNDQLLQGAEVLKLNAYFFGTAGDLNKSETYLKRALEITPTNSSDYAVLLNALGNHYLKAQDYAKAKIYLIKAEIYAKSNHDPLRYAKILGDLGRLYQKEKKYDYAIKNLKEDILISEKLNNDRNTTYARIQLGKIYLERKDYNQAKSLLLLANSYAEKKQYLKGFELEILQLLLEIAKFEKNDSIELKYRRKIEELEKVTSQNESPEVLKSINWKIQRENFNYKIESERLRAEKESLKNKIAYTVTVILSIGAIYIFYQGKRKRKIQYVAYENKLIKIELDKFKSEEKLERKEITLQNYKQYLKERNQQIEELEKILKTYQDTKNVYIAEHQSNLNELLNSHLMTEKNWYKFKATFIKEMPEYYDYLLKNFENLTESNLRLIFLQKLGLSNLEMANLLGVSIDAIKKAKQRLKKKYPDNFDDLFK